MKTSLLFFCCCCCSFWARAQFSFNDPNNEGQLSWYFCIGRSHYQPGWSDMNKFTTSFNTYHGLNLTEAFDPNFGANTNFRFETGLALANYIDIGLIYSPKTIYKNTATYINGESKELKLETYQTEVRFAGNLFRVGKVYGGFSMGAIFNKGQLFVGHRYNNGYLSYGNEQRLNGIYDSDHTNFSGGAQIYWLPTPFLTLIAHWERTNIFPNANTKLLGLKDRIDGYAPYYVNYTYPETFPTDFEAYQTGGNSNYGATPTLAGTRITLSVRFNWVFHPDE